MADGILILSEQRLPIRRERPPIALEIQAPRAGSVEILGGLAPMIGQLPLLWDFVASGRAKSAMEFAAYVLKVRGGRPAEAEVHKENMLEILRITEAARDRADQRWHDTMRETVGHLARSVAERSGYASKQAVAPIGRSVDQLQIGDATGDGNLIDAAMADVIREGGGATVGDQERIVVQVDGYQHHNRTLKIARLDGEGFMTANVTDPAFDNSPNLYTEAATVRARLVIDAKKTFRDGRIERLHISNAVEILAA
ncbi:hypothetical protein [Sphingomonas aerolata]|uniref:DUF7946 domain-containing protein n=1 Tax=Sphingomonas aerolata TaxID=185951 RepID=UPI00141BD6BC|nr:hypothetical protein [Sphingomonas aerolata]NII59814.1 hypothetical protein [Sphingomonas aerolata]